MDRKIAPSSKLIDKIDLVKPDVNYLDNGIPVYIINLGKQDVIKIEFVFNAGTWYEKHPLIAGFTNELCTAGTTSYNSEQIADIY